MNGFGQTAPSFRRLAPRACVRALLVSLVVLLAMAPRAMANVCDALRAQLGGPTRSSPEVAQLNKQLAAIRAFQRQRACSARNSGGLFNACGDLARRQAEVQRKIASAARSGGGRGAAIRARMASLGCTTNSGRQQRRDEGQAWARGNAMLFCVRLTDGYLFPAPNSQFVGAEDYELTLSRCQYICDEQQMDVYLLGDSTLETEEMLSIKSRQAYKELSSAFAYREAANFRACDWQRYNRRVNEARARTITPKTVDADAVVLPVPQSRPDVDGLTAYSDQTAAIATPDRKVRVVGAPYLPN